MPLFGINNFLLPPASWRRSFFVTLFFVTLAALLFWLDSFRLYESEIRVLIIGKTPSASTDQVVENFAELTSNLSFYERVLAGNDLIDDDFVGYSQDQRKALWNEAVRVKRSEGSGVLVVTARQDTSEKAKMLAEETVKTLFSVAGFYYNIQTDVDLRVVDGTIVKTTLRSPLQYGMVSFGSALVLTTLFFSLLSVTPFFFRRRPSSVSSGQATAAEMAFSDKSDQDFALGAAVPFIDPRKFVPARPTTLSFESSHEEQRIREEILAPVRTAPAPVVVPRPVSERMLPGMDMEHLPFEFEEVPPTGEMIREQGASNEVFSLQEPAVFRSEKAALVTNEVVPEVPVKTGEPTIEEYKRRLNELLSGGK